MLNELSFTQLQRADALLRNCAPIPNTCAVFERLLALIAVELIDIHQLLKEKVA